MVPCAVVDDRQGRDGGVPVFIPSQLHHLRPDSGCRVQNSGLRVWGSGFRLQGSWFRMWGSR